MMCYFETNKGKIMEISKDKSLTLSLWLAGILFVGCVVGLFVLPSLVRPSKYLGQKEDESRRGLEKSVNNLLETKITDMEEREETVFSFTISSYKARKALNEWKK